MESGAWVYILKCGDGSFYTGYTLDLERRLAEHHAGRGGRYTRSRLPVKLAFKEKWPSRRKAMQREAQLKSWPRRRKAALIRSQHK